MKHPFMLPTKEQEKWLDEQFEKAGKVAVEDRVNPMIAMFGKGPENVICKNCGHLFYNQPGRKKFYKCALRTFSRGAATDHKVKWPACGKYETAGDD